MNAPPPPIVVQPAPPPIPAAPDKLPTAKLKVPAGFNIEDSTPDGLRPLADQLVPFHFGDAHAREVPRREIGLTSQVDDAVDLGRLAVAAGGAGGVHEDSDLRTDQFVTFRRGDGVLELGELGELDRGQHDLGGVQPSEPVLDTGVEQPVVLRARLPAHAPDKPDRLHSLLLARPYYEHPLPNQSGSG